MVKNALGGTVNDVVLALCSGTLRDYLDGKGVHPERSLLAMIPISVRTEEQKGAMGNRVSSMFVALASDIDDPVERLHAITEGTRHAKEQEKAIDAGTLASDWVEFAAPALAARAARLHVPDAGRRPHRADVQRHGVQRARAAVPALLGRRADGGHVPDGADPRRLRAQHHRDELHGLDVLRARRLPRGGSRGLGHRAWDHRRARRAEEGGRRAPPARRPRRRAPGQAQGAPNRTDNLAATLRTWLSW